MGGRTGLVIAAVATGLSTGCETAPKTAVGAGIGTALGAGIGTVVGAATGDAGTGAVAGGLIGAGVGGLAGAAEDERDRRDTAAIQAANAQHAVRGPLSIDDVVQMSRPSATGSRVSEGVLIDYIRQTNSRFDLTPGDVRFLSDNGVSDRVVQEMINSRTRVAVGPPARTVIVREAVPPPVIVYERPYWGPRPWHYYPPPPPAVGVGFHFHKRR